MNTVILSDLLKSLKLIQEETSGEVSLKLINCSGECILPETDKLYNKNIVNQFKNHIEISIINKVMTCTAWAVSSNSETTSKYGFRSLIINNPAVIETELKILKNMFEGNFKEIVTA